ncbi:MAG TPA: hypothetical protein VM840_02225 [Actinomycetota bacterium]|nr:hypothetical protein [Actinomycetota bacterium]
MFSMPGPASMIAATLWLCMAAYLVVSLVRALVRAWADVHPAPARLPTFGVRRGDAQRAAA